MSKSQFPSFKNPFFMQPSLQLSSFLRTVTTINYRKILFLLLVIFSFTSQSQGQVVPPPLQWDKTLGGPVDDYLHAIVAASDGGYLLGGYYLQGGEGGESEPIEGSYDYYVVKINKDGTKEWDKTYGGDNNDFLFSIVNTADSGYLLGGYSLSGISGHKSEESRGGYDYWIIKIDKDGNKVWDKTYGGNDYDLLYTIVASPEGGFLLGGSSSSEIGDDKSEGSRGSGDYWIVKIDDSGNKQWDKSFGGSDFDNFKSIINTPDGGYLLGGYTQSGISGDKSDSVRGFYDYWIVKIDNIGNKVWDKTFGGSNLDELTAMIATSDSCYLLGGDSYSPAGEDKSDGVRGFNDYWIIKIDANGNKKWDKTFGGTGSEYFSSITAAEDGGYYFGGSSSSGISEDKSEENKGEFDYWIIKTDDAGNKQWDIGYGGNKSDNLVAIVAASDEGHLLGGQSNSGVGGNKSEPGLGGTDFWLVKLGTPDVKEDQTIVFDSIPDHTFGDTSFTITARTSSDLQIKLAVISGPAFITDSIVTLTGAGIVTIQASQKGDSTYNPAPSVSRTFEVHKGTPVITWNPASLVENVPLGEEQLNAEAAFKGAPVDGSFVYTPPAGTFLPIGTQTLKTDFTPVDTANFNYVVDITRTVTVQPSTDTPAVTLTIPDNIVKYSDQARIKLNAAVTNVSTIIKVQFYNDTTLLHTEDVYPYGFLWIEVPAGNYTLFAKATDDNGNVITSNIINVSVVAENVAPVVSIINPVNDTTYTGPATISLIAKAKDSNDKISKVEFYNDTTLLRTEFYPPYTYTWTNVQPGTYTITAVATDDRGLSATSEPVAITVSNATIVSSRPFSADIKTDMISLKLAPNPAGGTLQIFTNGLKQNKPSAISVISASGVVMKTINSNTSKQTVQLDISSLVSGVYTLKVISGDKVMYKQFIKL